MCERGCDAAVSACFREVAEVAIAIGSGLPVRGMEAPYAACGGPAGSGQERPSVRLIHGAHRSTRSAGETSALFSVGPLEEEVEKEVASEDAKREKQCG